MPNPRKRKKKKYQGEEVREADGYELIGKPFGPVQVGTSKADLYFAKDPYPTRDKMVGLSEHGTVYDFSGHRVCFGVEITESNYYKSKFFSGNSIRGTCVCSIKFDGRLVYSFFCHDAKTALVKAMGVIDQLCDHALDFTDPSTIIGREVYYQGKPAVIKSWYPDQGAIVVESVDGKGFGYSRWMVEPDDEYEQEMFDEMANDPSAKIDVFSHDVCWFRKTK